MTDTFATQQVELNKTYYDYVRVRTLISPSQDFLNEVADRNGIQLNQRNSTSGNRAELLNKLEASIEKLLELSSDQAKRESMPKSSVGEKREEPQDDSPPKPKPVSDSDHRLTMLRHKLTGLQRVQSQLEIEPHEITRFLHFKDLPGVDKKLEEAITQLLINASMELHKAVLAFSEAIEQVASQEEP